MSRSPITLAASFLIITGGVATGCTECDLREHAQELAGSGAVDCGYVALGESRVEADACSVDAFRQGRAFYALVQAQGTDSKVIDAVAGNSGGEVWRLSYDSDTSGGDKAGARISRISCLEPAVMTATEGTSSPTAPQPGTEYIGCARGGEYRVICEE